ncbi:von Willebrand factor type A domain-containing protein [Streptomyces sp. 2333.5]|uniref:vWA domain-containing protein n=1 Tax=unclassified Streptomyces TaxID=2593676 RepID=UPI00089664DE|nr:MULTISPECIES: VWA domain-containing protein [unclassified Streptomyces]PJJ01981.1 von Willebrand factor type A domain-containing protein [Streptomyces sp. 2333.5]SEC90194.1 von Willebrand factor type A domain-containing protein [Streptomyces sp. 2314.4]SED75569.1 von Willebrand factor type A domain-containing protein [Streptomyces sp. 2112.2]
MAHFAKSPVPRFSAEVYQNPYLPEGGREVHAVVTVTATGGGTTGGRPVPAGAGRPDAGVVIMVDCSGSMAHPPSKLRGAREATAAALDAVRDGVGFAVVAGTHRAVEVYPGGGRLAVADAQTRAQAGEALRALGAGGGTAIGSWLRLTGRLLSSTGAGIRHAILLTDGRNEHESPQELRAALDACQGSFTCDARGVGTDWEVKEVTGIASALLGTADIVADPAGLAADFTRMMETAMGKEVADVGLRLWTPLGAETVFVKQVAPTVADLTGRRRESGPRSGDYPTGSWGDESRDYHLCVRVPAAGVGQEMLAARVSLIISGPDGDPAGPSPQPLSQALVRAVWTDDVAASTSINPQVAHYTGQAELAQAIQQGLDARKSGDTGGATAKLGRAVQLAGSSGNEETAKLLAKVVDVVDAATGTVRLKATVAEADEMTLETRSTKTVRVKK